MKSRKKYRCIYTSSYDRGLIYALKNWSRVREEIPEAELHIFYGWDLFDKINRNNPERMAWKQKMVELMGQPGVQEHGRVGHDRLHEELLKSDIHIYPSSFQEISCISCMKSQALGAIPFVTDFAALSETVKFGVRVDVDITTDDGQEEFFNELIKFMRNDKKRDELREPMMSFCQDYFLWSKVAQDWSTVFKRELGE